MGKFSTRDIIVQFSAPGKDKIIQDLHMDVKVLRNIDGRPNTCELKIFNLNQDSRDFFSSLYKDDKAQMNMEVIVGDNFLFSGDVVNAQSVFISPTWETTIYGCEGYNAYRATETKEVPANTTREDLVQGLISGLSEFGINAETIDALKSGCGKKSILKRILVDGNVLDNIKKFVSDCFPDNDIFVDGEKLVVLPKDQTLPKTTTLDRFLEPPTLNEEGVSCKTQLNTEISVGGTINLQAKSYNKTFGNLTTNRANKSRFSGEGTYKVIEIRHFADNFTSAVARTETIGVFIQ